MKQTKKRIIYDDTCPMCIAVVTEVDDSSKGNSFTLEGIPEAKLPQGVTREQAQKEMHVIDQDGNIYRNVDAMLQIVEEYPRWRFLVKIARLPIIYQILQLLYKVVAGNRHFIFGPSAGLYWLKNIVVIGTILGILLSLPLWVGNSSFPEVPLLPFLPHLPIGISVVALIATLGMLLGALISPRPRLWLFGAIGGLVFLVLFNQMRLQPWLYQYAWMLVVLSLYSWHVAESANRRVALQTLRIIVGSIYFFSGLQKVNPDFMTTVFPWMVEPLTSLFPGLQTTAESIGVLIPFVELGIGVSLFVPKLRKIAVILAAAMAGCILLLIGPLGHGWNYVVWPWNIVMPLSAAILFWRAETVNLKDTLRIKRFVLQKIAIVVFILLPFLSFYGKWDSYLSWTLYSGNITTAAIFLDESAAKALPGDVQRYVEQTSKGLRLSILDWSMGAVHVPPYPETRVFKAVTAQLCREVSDNRGMILEVQEKFATTPHASQRYYCSEL